MRLNLGSSDDLKADWMNVDIAVPLNVVMENRVSPEFGLGPDLEGFQLADLDEPWPWDSSSAEAIMAHDVFEHILDCQHVGPMICRKCYGPDYGTNGRRPAYRRGNCSGCAICGMMPCMCRLRAFYGHIHALNESWRVLKPGGKLDIKVPAVALSDGSVNPGASCDPTHRNFWHEDIRYYFCDKWADPHTGERGRLGPGMGIVGMFKLIHCSTDDYGAGRERRSKLSLILEAVK